MRNVFMLLIVFVLAGSVDAATYYMTVDSVTITSASPYETNMYSLVLQVQYSAPSGISMSNCRAKVSSLPSGWNVLDDFDSNYKTLSTCSGTTTFSIMPTTTGSFSGSNLVVEVKGTSTDSGNTVNPGTGSPSGTLTVQNQPVLDLTILSVSSTNITSTGNSTLEYRVTNTGDPSDTAPTENLRLELASTPFGSIVFQDSSTVYTPGTGILAPGDQITGSVVVKTSGSVSSNDLTYILTAAADNTEQSSAGGGGILCRDCISSTAYLTVLYSGWNLISFPVTL